MSCGKAVGQGKLALGTTQLIDTHWRGLHLFLVAGLQYSYMPLLLCWHIVIAKAAAHNNCDAIASTAVGQAWGPLGLHLHVQVISRCLASAGAAELSAHQAVAFLGMQQQTEHQPLCTITSTSPLYWCPSRELCVILADYA